MSDFPFAFSQSPPYRQDDEKLSGFTTTMFSSEEEKEHERNIPNHNESHLYAYPPSNNDDEDPLDDLFSPPIQQYLTREDSRDHCDMLDGFPKSSFSTTTSRQTSLQIVTQELLANDDRDMFYDEKLLAAFRQNPDKSQDECQSEDEPDLLDMETAFESLFPTPVSSATPSTTQPSLAASISSLSSRRPEKEAAVPLTTPTRTTRSAGHARPHQVTPVGSVQPKLRKPAAKTLPRSAEASGSNSPLIITHTREVDVLFGKGGLINKHVGNVRYHQAKKGLQQEYLDQETSKDQKRILVKQLHDIVVNDWGGRFLRRVHEGSKQNDSEWVEAHRDAAMEKCRQALATPERSREERAARRRMFLEKKKRKTSRSTSVEAV